MKLNFATLLLSSSLCIYSATAFSETDALAPIIVKADNNKNPNFKNYNKPAAVSSRATDVNAMQNLDSIIRTVSGAYTQMDPSQGAVSVNIRGTTGLGRVNTLVDGVPQTYLGTSAKSNKFHEGANGPTSQFGTLIDQNFLTRVDISKGHTSGAAGLNALSGTAEFKTIDADDVILEGNRLGVLTKFNLGNNDLGRSGMIAVAGKTPVFKTGEINGLVAFSKHKLSQNYKRGDGSYAQDSDYMIPLEQHPESYLAKFAVKPDQNSEIKLSARTYKNNIGGRDINSKTYMLESKYNPSKLVDLSVLMSHSKTSQIYDEDARLWTIQKASTKNTSNYLDIHNKSEINLAKNTDLTLKYGATYLKNNYVRTVPFEGNDIGAIKNLALSPAGTQETKSLYFNTELNWGIVSLTPEISYSHYKLTGISPACDSDDAVYCTIPEEVKINNKHNIVNPSIGLAVNITDWLQPFARYYHTSRPVNVQEMFNTSRNGLTVNSNLRPEKAQTYELGLNISKDKLFTNNDILGLKVIYFNSRIKDYIFNTSLFSCINGLCYDQSQLSDTHILQAQIYDNATNIVKNKGWEVELNYDSDYFFANLSYTHTHGNIPTSRAAEIFSGFGLESYTELPKDYATLELGTKLLDKKLNLSTIIKYTGSAKRTSIGELDEGQIKTENLPKIPIVVDLYAQYHINKNIVLKAGIQNLMNKNYLNALDTYNSSTNEAWDDETETYKFTNTARGRTYTFATEIRF